MADGNDVRITAWHRLLSKAKHKTLRAWDYKYVYIVYNSIKQFYELM